MLHIGFMDFFQPVALNQLDNPLKTRPNVRGERIVFRLYPLIEKFNGLRHSSIILQICNIDESGSAFIG